MLQSNFVTGWLKSRTNVDLHSIVICFALSFLVIGLVVTQPAGDQFVYAVGSSANTGSGNNSSNNEGSSGNGANQGEIYDTLKDYTINLIEKVYYADSDLSMWHYKVTSPEGEKDISHWNLELCHKDPKTCEAGTDDSEHNVNNATYPEPWDVNCDPSISDPFWGIKWDVGFDADDGDDVKHFYLYLEGNWQQGEVAAAIKAGQNEYYGTVQGPLCQKSVPEDSMKASLGNLTIVQTNAVGDEVALADLGHGSCDTCAPFSTDLEVSFTTSCSNYEVKAYYTVDEASGSSPSGADAAINGEFDNPVLKIKNNGSYNSLGRGLSNFVTLSGFSNDNCNVANPQTKQCGSFPVEIDLARLGNMSSGWKFDFTVHLVLECSQ